MLTEHQFDAGEFVINYAEGEPNGPPLVMLHGATVNWQSFFDLIPTLEQRWHLYACDLRGHGKSGRSRAGYRIVDYVPDTVAFMERIIGGPAVLLGFSLGANIALGVGAQRPDLMRALVLLDPNLMAREVSVREIGEAYDWLSKVNATLASARSLAELEARCKEHWPDMDDAGGSGLAEMLASLDPASVACILRDQMYAGFDLEQVLPRLECPTLLVRGERELDSVIRDSDAAFFQVLAPRATIVQVKGVGHGIIWGPPAQEVLGHVCEFLEAS